MDSKDHRKIVALKVNQWLKEWEDVDFNPEENRAKPNPCFYLFTLSAPELKALTGINRREIKPGQLRSNELGIQRRHDPKRSKEIEQFIPYGYPWSELNEVNRKSKAFDDLRKPGWLPTAIVINILDESAKRSGKKVSKDDLVSLSDKGSYTEIILPKNFNDASWKPKEHPPFEVIDGQHRLWAFENQDLHGKFELPVVAFYGLDISWQAYLFWTINIRPKKINRSLAFDLYPLLRTEEWLDKFEGHKIYRETRAQEIVEAIWNYPKSPWYQKIDMLGELGGKRVSQAAWIRALIASYIKNWDGGRSNFGGLFGSKIGSNKTVLSWSRLQQASFLIFLGNEFLKSITNSHEKWAEKIRESKQSALFEDEDKAFYNSYSLLSSDQGIRAILLLTNDLLFSQSDELKLHDWTIENEPETIEVIDIDKALESLSKLPVAKFITNLTDELSKYDWTSASAPWLTNDERKTKLVFRGSGGYVELEKQLLEFLSKTKLGKISQEVLNRLRA